MEFDFGEIQLGQELGFGELDIQNEIGFGELDLQDEFDFGEIIEEEEELDFGEIELQQEFGFGELELDIIQGAGDGTTDYNRLTNKPKINGIELVGDKTSEELNIQATIDEISDETIEEIVNVRIVNADEVYY